MSTDEREVKSKRVAEMAARIARTNQELITERIKAYEAQMQAIEELKAELHRASEAQARYTESLARALEQSSSDNRRTARRFLWLTLVVALAGICQAVATAWPYLIWWLREH